VFLLLAVGGPLIFDVLGVESLTIGTLDRFSFRFSFTSTPTKILMSVGSGVLGIGAAVGLLYPLFGTIDALAHSLMTLTKNDR
jgi:hypothetical protein